MRAGEAQLPESRAVGAQDTNRLQAAIILALKPSGRGLTVVGDDAQSIYSFRGTPADWAMEAVILY
jgi:superfamily I DNA/RNA helicase